MDSARESPAYAESIRVHGVVQGVGFRPTVYRLACELGLRGSVRNDGGGVSIVVGGAAATIDTFVQALQQQAPPLARIDRIERMPCSSPHSTTFGIAPSVTSRVRTGVGTDAAPCAACLSEMRDATDRRAGHPFVNCTHCGPRFSIVRALPYDRANTSMAHFTMCAACRNEYCDPTDRRFHAQPNACPDCGPTMWAESNPLDGVATGTPTGHAALLRVLDWLRAGCIVAIKGLGGYQLACDAGNDDAVRRLRERKRRPDKPLALMARDVAMAERHAVVSMVERTLLLSTVAPIVLLTTRVPSTLSSSVAPRQRTLGFMLPNTPMHHLLMAQLEGPIVLTSGNALDEPQCIDDDDARARLGAIADGFLMHDRVIVNRVDDSVMRVIDGTARVLRRGRGLAPASLPLPPGFERAPSVLALGGELKNTICLIQDGRATVSQHLGDLQNTRAVAAFVDTVGLYEQLYESRVEVIAIDRHPEYRASRHGRHRAAAQGLALVDVQHHHAHIAACMAEHGLALEAAPVLGMALDGLGYGDDGTFWGGEFLRVDYLGCERLACLRPVPMPGGEQAIHEPWRMAWSYLTLLENGAAWQPRYADLPFMQRLQQRPLRTLESMLRAGINVPLTSSCGRLCDAVAALLGLGDVASYEGQLATELEASVDRDAWGRGNGYAFALTASHIDPAPMWLAVLDDLVARVPVGVIAARFHLGLVHALVAMTQRLTQRANPVWQPRVVLSGGVFQNALLLSGLTRHLEVAGYAVLSPSRVPANDGGLALGQAVVASARFMNSTAKVQACASASPVR